MPPSVCVSGLREGHRNQSSLPVQYFSIMKGESRHSLVFSHEYLRHDGSQTTSFPSMCVLLVQLQVTLVMEVSMLNGKKSEIGANILFFVLFRNTGIYFFSKLRFIHSDTS